MTANSRAPEWLLGFWRSTLTVHVFQTTVFIIEKMCKNRCLNIYSNAFGLYQTKRRSRDGLSQVTSQ
jgi:hypothetical protein